MPYSLSILGKNNTTNKLVESACVEADKRMGYVGGSELELLNFFKSEYNFHILFLFPSINYSRICCSLNEQDQIKVNIVILGTMLPEDNISFLINSGVSGFISIYNLSSSLLLQIYDSIKEKGYVVNDHIPQKWWDTLGIKGHEFPRETPGFSQVESEIAYWLVNGKTVAQIAGIRNKTESSIRFHLKNLMEKTNTFSLNELLITCIANLWVKVDLSKTKFTAL